MTDNAGQGGDGPSGMDLPDPALRRRWQPSKTETELTFLQSVSAYFRLWRYQPKMILGLFLLMYLGWLSLAGGLDSLDRASVARAIVGWLAATSILIAIFLVNDAADRDIDCIAHPERPIPQGKAAWRHVAIFGVLLLVAGVVLSLMVNRSAALVAVAMALLGAAHYGYAKGRLTIPCSSEIITPMVSALFPVYALAVGGFAPWSVAVSLVVFIYFADLAQDLLGGIHDQEGDRRCGIRTFALAIGDRATLGVSSICLLVAVVGGFVLYQSGPAGLLYLLVFSGLTLYMLYLYAHLWRKRGASLREEAGRVNHLAGGYFFLVSASTLPDFLLRSWIS